jgi:hypothetical protein
MTSLPLEYEPDADWADFARTILLAAAGMQPAAITDRASAIDSLLLLAREMAAFVPPDGDDA